MREQVTLLLRSCNEIELQITSEPRELRMEIKSRWTRNVTGYLESLDND